MTIPSHEPNPPFPADTRLPHPACIPAVGKFGARGDENHERLPWRSPSGSFCQLPSTDSTKADGVAPFTPSLSTLRRIMVRLNFNQLSDAFNAWAMERRITGNDDTP